MQNKILLVLHWWLRSTVGMCAIITFVCACVYARACVCARVHVCVRVRMRVYISVDLRQTFALLSIPGM